MKAIYTPTPIIFLLVSVKGGATRAATSWSDTCDDLKAIMVKPVKQ